ncbi:MAG: sensor histidine kinase, partial [Acidobacteriota bacterium]
LDAMKTDFVHMVSHELRSPMAAVKQQLSVILEGLAGEVTTRQREMLDRSQERIQGLLDLVNELLDIARMEGGGEARQMVPVQLRTIIESTVELMRPQAEQLSIDISMDLPPEAPLVQADPRGMEEVFTNLIGNAIRYSPDGGTVTISTLPCGSYLEVLVSDTGIGIPAEEIPKIFDKFYRVKHPRTRKVIGTGLGLAIVKGIVDAHRGAIRVESEPGVGTTFRVTLPTTP